MSDGIPTTSDVTVTRQSPVNGVICDDVISSAVSNDNERSLSDMLASAYSDSSTDPSGDMGHDTSDDKGLDPMIALELEIMASRVELDGIRREKSSLDTAVELLMEEIEGYKKVCNNQKQECKRMKNENDQLRREVSQYKGIRKYTEKPNEASVNKANDEVLIAKAKLASLKESMIRIADDLINVIDGDDDRDTTEYTTVTSRRRSHVNFRSDDVMPTDDVPDSSPHVISVVTPSTMMRDAAVDGIRHGGPTARPPAVPVVTSTRTYSQAVSARAQRPGTTEQKRPLIIGTSLTKGAGSRLHDRGVSAECYTYAGCEIPHIKDRIRHVISKPRQHSICVLQAGGNDAERRPVEHVISQYNALIDEVRRCTPGTDIMISAIPPRRNNTAIINKIESINAHLQQKCSIERGLHYVQVFPDQVKLYKKDKVHFNIRGANVYAMRLASAIKGFHSSQLRNMM